MCASRVDPGWVTQGTPRVVPMVCRRMVLVVLECNRSARNAPK